MDIMGIMDSTVAVEVGSPTVIQLSIPNRLVTVKVAWAAPTIRVVVFTGESSCLLAPVLAR